MGVIGNAFRRELGKNAAKTASNILFGDKWSTPYRRTNEAREKRAEADRERAEALKIRQQAEAERIRQQNNEQHSNYINAIDNAVIQNINQVIALQFDDSNPAYLCHQLQGLIVQLKVNSLSEETDEEKVRAKYTKAVLEKSKQGFEILKAIDPLNKQIPYFDKKIYEAEHWDDKRKFKKCLIISAYVAFFLGLLFSIPTGTIVGFISAAFLWGIFMLFVHMIRSIKRKKRNRKYNYIIKAHMRERQISEEKHNVLASELEQLKAERVNPAKTHSDEMKSDIVKQTEAIWEKHHALHPILERGFQVCETRGHKDILVMKLCSNDAKGFSHSGEAVYQFPTLIDFSSDWQVEMDMLVGHDFNLLSVSTSLNLFSCKECINPLVTDIIQNPRTFNYVVDQVTVTQNIIEDIIKPKVIIVLNKEVEAFFGHVKRLTWMGYTFRTVGNINGLEVLEITGFSDARDRLAQDTRHQTNLIGTKIIFTSISEYKKYPKAEQLRQLL